MDRYVTIYILYTSYHPVWAIWHSGTGLGEAKVEQELATDKALGINSSRQIKIYWENTGTESGV